MKITAFRATKCITSPLKRGDVRNGVQWEDAGLFRIESYFVAEWDLADGNTIRCTGNPGFVFNFRSGPAIIDLVLPKSGPAGAVWCAHDILFNDGDVVQFSDAQKLMRYGLKACGIGGIRSWLAGVSVDIFGREAYDTDTKQSRRGLCKVERIPTEAAKWSSPVLVGVSWDIIKGRR